MRKVGFVCATFTILTLSSCAQTKDKYTAALEYIRRDSASLRNLNLHDAGVVIGEKSINFDLIAVADDVIKSDYIPSYNIFRELTDTESKLRQRVMDSLEFREQVIKSEMVIKGCNHRLRSNKGKTNYYISFSCVVDGYLFVEVMDSSDSAYGTVLCYLFVFRQNLVERVYFGVVSRN